MTAVALRGTTWTARDLPTPDRSALVRWFEELDREVRSARRVRMLWRYAGGLLGLGAAVYVVPPLLQGVLENLVP